MILLFSVFDKIGNPFSTAFLRGETLSDQVYWFYFKTSERLLKFLDPTIFAQLFERATILSYIDTDGVMELEILTYYNGVSSFLEPESINY